MAVQGKLSLLHSRDDTKQLRCYSRTKLYWNERDETKQNKLKKIGSMKSFNGTPHFKKCKQLFEYQHVLLIRDIRWSKF